jgi:hypothetical protein
MATIPQTDFEKELEIFRIEEEVAQQYFFAYLSVRSLAAENEAVLRVMNDTPLFWITTHHAMLLSAFIALGRIFDQSSNHNVDRLISTAANDMSVFSKNAQNARMLAAGISQQTAAEYLHHRYELTADDLRALRKDIKHWRRVYENRLQDVRHKVFAHREIADTDGVNKLFANIRIDELQGLFAFLSAVYTAFWEQFHNGRKFSLDIRDWVLSNPHSPGISERPGEMIYREGQEALLSMLPSPAKSAPPS